MTKLDTSHLLDTNICSYLMRARPKSVVERLAALGPERVAVSVITEIELRQGAERSGAPAKYHRVIDAFVDEIPVLPLPSDLGPVGDAFVPCSVDPESPLATSIASSLHTRSPSTWCW